MSVFFRLISWLQFHFLNLWHQHSSWKFSISKSNHQFIYTIIYAHTQHKFLTQLCFCYSIIMKFSRYHKNRKCSSILFCLFGPFTIFKPWMTRSIQTYYIRLIRWPLNSLTTFFILSSHPIFNSLFPLLLDVLDILKGPNETRLKKNHNREASRLNSAQSAVPLCDIRSNKINPDKKKEQSSNISLGR